MLVFPGGLPPFIKYVSVAGCLGYDVLVTASENKELDLLSFSCWLFRL